VLAMVAGMVLHDRGLRLTPRRKAFEHN
jgi:hypothetical protein